MRGITKKIHLTLPIPTEEDCVSDQERIQRALKNREWMQYCLCPF